MSVGLGSYPRQCRCSDRLRHFWAYTAEARGLRFKVECVLCGGWSVQPLARGFWYRNSFLAFLRVNRQLILVRFWLALRFHARTSRCNVSRSGIRRLPRHCRETNRNLISPYTDQPPGLGVLRTVGPTRKGPALSSPK